MSVFSGIPSNHFILVVCILCLGVLCGGQTEFGTAQMEKAEQAALYSAIQGFVGNWWNGSDLYPDPCGWTPIQGVSCDIFDGLWYVTDLSIGLVHDNSLECAPEVEFRPQLFELKHLKSLTFFNCFTSPRRHPVSFPSDNWEKLSGNLESLEFRSNPGLVGQVPTSFAFLTKLQSLVLLQNGLKGEIPENIGKLSNLRRLVLAGNWFTGKAPGSFGSLTELLILDLSRNSLSGPLPLAFGGLTSLLKLDLSYNQLQGKLPGEIGNLKNLTLLDLRSNRFCDGLSQSLQEMHSLEELVLSNNQFGGNLLSLDWRRLPNLVILDLSNVGLSGEIPESIVGLTKLRFLGLSNNNLTGNLSPKLASLPSVSTLYLNGNNLTGELKFPGDFYGKMGRRFGAWNNPNLCYPVSLMTTSHVPYGVNPCQEDITLADPNSMTKLGDPGNMNQNFHFVISLGFSSYDLDGLLWVFLVNTLVMVQLSNFPL
ncbi:hypothetical protein SLEP1_g4408 [Rubroshorea leprosula]|uniref:Disease resistance R13L4/SHOC-2-like LRR domain-containing protein n=1 Tax=Rubroshorea leprosula TaxID=152421 RepID=A0AAV5HNK6_9ROSI|nr:hypothetical protein SLEP1_g4408 [Rubroshorea leprosula]